ncbi:MAG: Wzz/FepE/Etk N-terminal domain-containing protein [Paracoccaceae bacterium]
MDKKFDDEVNLFELLQIIWDGKWIIIVTTFIGALLGVGYALNKEKSFEVSTRLTMGGPSAFIEYIPLNSIIKENNLNLASNSSEFGYTLNSESILKMIVHEFNDYSEMRMILQENEFVKNSIKDLTEEETKLALAGFAKNFEILPPSRDEKNWTLKLTWYNPSEGKKLFDEALHNSIANVRAGILNDISKLADFVDEKNQREIDELESRLSLIEEKHQERMNKRLQFLAEQSAIAKELGMENNIVGENNFSQVQATTDTHMLGLSDSPIYLRGFKALDKTISLIKNRSKEEGLLMAVGYLETKLEIRAAKEDLKSFHLRETIDKVANTDEDLVKFDFAFSEIINKNKPRLYVALCLILGGVLGGLYVIFSNVIRKHKSKLAEM